MIIDRNRDKRAGGSSSYSGRLARARFDPANTYLFVNFRHNAGRALGKELDQDDIFDGAGAQALIEEFKAHQGEFDNEEAATRARAGLQLIDQLVPPPESPLDIPPGTVIAAFAGLPSPANRGTFALAITQNDTAIDLDIFEAVGESMFSPGISAKAVRAKLKGSKSPINVKINSKGGDVFDGLAIFEMLSEHAAPVTVDITGIAASIASVIAMAGRPIRMAKTATLMLHNPWSITAGEASDLRKTADVLDKSRAALIGVYARRTGQSSDRIAAMMDAETWLTATEAKQLGFADEIR
jgi:ATP-dependent Clp endopeptidase proteolytic subunit ClpP